MDDVGSEHTAPSPIPSDTDFEVNDVVLAFHGHLLYEARVLRVHREGDASDGDGDGEEDSKRAKKGKVKRAKSGGGLGRVESYTVHYQGWKKSWEETVPRNTVYEHNDENLRVAHELLNGARLRQQALHPVSDDHEGEANSEDKGDGSRSGSGSGSGGGVGGSSSKGKDTLLETPSQTDQLFFFPAALQRQLVDDWEFITKEDRLVTLPRTPCVADILSTWISTVTKRNTTPAVDISAYKEVADAIQYYFDTTVAKTLLYRFERKQYSDYFNKASSPPPQSNGHGNDQQQQQQQLPSYAYGAEHLLRLLHKLPYMLECAGIPHETLALVAEIVNDLTRYMHRAGRIIFMIEYPPAPKAYIKNAISS